MSMKLKPCPRCGDDYIDYEVALDGTAYMACQHCGLEGPGISPCQHADPIDTAERRWNEWNALIDKHKE